MFPQAYLDFDLAFQASNRGYEARVLNSPAGETLTQFRLPFSEAEAHPLNEWFNTLDAIQTFGSQLFDTIFVGELLHCFRRSQEVAHQRQAGLRIRLRFTDSPALAQLPWEYLYDPLQANFLSLSETTPIVRFLEIPRPLQPFTFQLPLRFLLVAANPAQLPPLASDQECRAIGEALRTQGQQEIILEQRYGATLQTVQQTLQNHEYHVLHFSGHAGVDEGTQAGMIYLEDEEGLAVAVTGRQLSVLSDELASVRLVVLNADETGRASPTNFYGGVAQSLVQQGIPAVIAMQFPISERLAITFAQAFYTALANSAPVEVALSRARKAIYLQGDTVGWGAPVLFMRTPDGQLFATDRTPAEDAVIPEKPNFWQKLGLGRRRRS